MLFAVSFLWKGITIVIASILCIPGFFDTKQGGSLSFHAYLSWSAQLGHCHHLVTFLPSDCIVYVYTYSKYTWSLYICADAHVFLLVKWHSCLVWTWPGKVLILRAYFQAPWAKLMCLLVEKEVFGNYIGMDFPCSTFLLPLSKGFCGKLCQLLCPFQSPFPPPNRQYRLRD